MARQRTEEIRKQFTVTPNEVASASHGSYSFTQWDNHPSGLSINLVDPYAIQPNWAKIHDLTPTEKYGHSTRQVLQRYGYHSDTIQKLLAKGVISESWGKAYLPE